MQKVVHTICFMCTVRCPIDVVVENDEVVSINGNAYVPAMNGGVCPKGAAAIATLNDAQRVQAPMIRTGDRGSGQWKKVSWDEALDYTADKCKEIFAKYGSKSAVYCERDNLISDISKTFQKAIGSPNRFTHDTMCKGSINTACRSIIGYTDAEINADWGNTRHAVLYGRNVFETGEIKAMNALIGALSKGAKMTYIDPRVTISAAKSTDYKMIRPGGDLAFNYALMHVIIKEKLYDAQYVDRWVKGFRQLSTFVDPYTPEWAEAESGIPAGEIIELARKVSASRPSVFFHYGYRGSHHPTEVYFRRSIMILNALMGSIEAKGGIFIKKGSMDAGLKAGLRKFSDQKFPEMEETGRFDGCGEKGKFPIVDKAHGVGSMLPHAILNEDPYPIKVLFAFRFDPLYSSPNYQQSLKALQKLDFIVSSDINFGGTTAMADVILPESFFLERSDPLQMGSGLKPTINRRIACVKPRFDTKPMWWILKQLAVRFGTGKFFPYETIEDIWNYQLTDIDIKIEDFDEKGFVSLSDKPIWWDRKNGIKFKTPSAKIEFVSSLMEDNGIPSLPLYEKLEVREGVFRLMCGRCMMHSNVATQNNPYLNEFVSENVLWINKNRADDLCINNNDMVELESKVGKGRMKAFVTDMIHPEAVFMLHGFGHNEIESSRSYQRGVADAMLQESIMDKVGGSPAYDHTWVNVRKV